MSIAYLGVALAQQAPAYKLCTNCGKAFTRREFLRLPLPSSGLGESEGLYWRNCDRCFSTLVIDVKDTPFSASAQLRPV